MGLGSVGMSHVYVVSADAARRIRYYAFEPPVPEKRTMCG